MKTKTMMIAVIMISTVAAPIMAAPPAAAKGDDSQVVLSWSQFVKITGYDPANKTGGGQIIKVPWADIENLLGVKVERVGAASTVDLPWKEFRALLEHSLKKGDDKPAPPADYIVSSSQYTGTLSQDGAEFTLEVKVNILKEKGWKRIPVLPVTVALKSSKIPEKVHLNVNGGNYELLTDKTGEITASLTFAVAVTKSGGMNSLTFQRPVAGSSVLKLTVEGGEADVKVAGAQALNATDKDGKTTVAAALPTGLAAQISWQRAIRKVKAAPTKMYAQTNTLVSVADGLLLCQESVSYNILHTAVRELTLNVPADASVLTVMGSNVQSWRVEKGELKVVLGAETIGSYMLSIAYEKATKKTGDTPVPLISCTGVEREKGFVAVVALANVEIGAGQVKSATPIDARRLPGSLAAMTNQPILLGFRYVGNDVQIPLTIKKHGAVSVLVTVADNLVVTGMQLNDGRRMTKVLYSIRNNRNQFLRLKMPAGSEIWSVSVSGKTVTPGKDEKGNVLIPLVRSTSSASELTAFPVNIVYVETPDKKAPAMGKMKVELPVCDVPVMHVMYNAYLPAEGRYTVGWGKNTFEGPLKIVEKFASLSTSTGAVVIANAPAQAMNMQKQFNQRADIAVRKAGETPIRVKLPLDGTQVKLEKILALPGDELWFSYEYSRWNQ